MRKRECLAISLIVFFACSYFGLLIVEMIYDHVKKLPPPWQQDVFLGFLVTLTVMYSLVIISLNKTMQKIIGDFRREKRSVNTQFSVFLFGYAFLCIFVLVASSPLEKKLGYKNMETAYLIVVFF